MRDEERDEDQDGDPEEDEDMAVEIISKTAAVVNGHVVTLNRGTGELFCNCPSARQGLSCWHVHDVARFARRRRKQHQHENADPARQAAG